MRAARFTAIVLVAVVALAGCSSGKKAATGSPSTTPTSASAPAPTTTASRPPSTDPFCVFVRTYNDRFGRINPAALSDPQQFKAAMQDASAAIKEAANTAPASIRADVATMSQAVQKLLDSFQQVNFDMTRISVAALTQLQAPEFIAAGRRLDDYTRQNCA